MKISAPARALALLALSFSYPTWAALRHPNSNASTSSRPKWLLRPFLNLSAKDPAKLLETGEKLFSEDRIRITTVEPSLAFEWQHRLAMVSALSDLFDPAHRLGTKQGRYRAQARSLITKALAKDPSLLVRDGAVESIRRIVRMQPGERGLWKLPLEQAFLNPRNILDGEGFFIRETILTALREAALMPSAAVKRAAAKDKNLQVRDLLKAWNSRAYDNI